MSTLPEQAEFGWSFCIPSVVGSEHQLSQVINSIALEFSESTDFEIIIIGACAVSKLKNLISPGVFQHLQFLPFKEEHFSFNWKRFRRAIKKGNFRDALMREGWITRKKNLLVQHARFENICLLHDYVALLPGWREGYSQYGFDWEVCMNTVLNKNQTRHRDWLVWDYPGVGAALLPYEVGNLSQFMYISGTYFCVKKKFMTDNPLNEKLHWGESEDVEWSKHARRLTDFKFNPYSRVIYVKEKSLTEPPYCDDWQNNARLLAEKLGV